MGLSEREIQIGVGCFVAGSLITAIVIHSDVETKLKKANKNFHTRLGVMNNCYKRLYEIKTDPTKTEDDLRKAIAEENTFLDMVINKPVIS